jgi:hypothetical protein
MSVDYFSFFHIRQDIPSIFYLFMDKKYEELRGKWAEIIEWRSNSFRGCDGQVMMPPFHKLIEFKYSYECSIVTCPLNRTEFCMPSMNLRYIIIISTGYSFESETWSICYACIVHLLVFSQVKLQWTCSHERKSLFTWEKVPFFT